MSDDPPDVRCPPDVRWTGCPVPSGLLKGRHQRTRKNTGLPIGTGCPTHRMSGAHRTSDGQTPVDLQKYRTADPHRMSDSPDVRLLTDVRYVSPRTLRWTGCPAPTGFRREDTSGLAKISDCRSAPDVRHTGCPVPNGCPVCFTQHTPVH